VSNVISGRVGVVVKVKMKVKMKVMMKKNNQN
jgi:hypothetical protein